MRLFLLFFCFSLSFISLAGIEVKRIEPMHWWVGMKNRQLSLLLYGPGIGECKPSIKTSGITLKSTEPVSNANYLFLNLEISASAKPGKYSIELADQGEKKIIQYELKSRQSIPTGAQGFSQKDVMYLIMPDRFANGDSTNDFVEGMLERPNRTEPFGRHGGDLKGIENNLDYFKELGINTLWLNPIIENNQPHSSYHGYAFTDFYKVDPRFGTLDDYKRLIAKCHANGMKMVQDMVANHIGSKHWWMLDKPDLGWIHPEGDPFYKTNFRIETVSDPNGSPEDKNRMEKGWFDIHMADLNQNHRLLGQYLIQNSIWWIAETGIDGIRMDTYPYNEKNFMTRWCEAILKEFPSFNIVGEVWVDPVSLASYYAQGAKNQDGYKAGLPSVTDFPLYFAMTRALNEAPTWDNGLIKIYIALAQDFLYKDASRNLIFTDNHDLTRIFTSLKKDYRKYQQAMAMLLTLRGVPQLYYGDEILMTGDAASHPEVRRDFPGGWPGDTENYFLASTRKEQKDSAFKLVQRILNWRRNSTPIHKGKFVQFLPEENVYVYFRIHQNKKVMVVINGNDSAKKLKMSRFRNELGNSAKGMDVISGNTVDLATAELVLSPMAAMIIDCANTN